MEEGLGRPRIGPVSASLRVGADQRSKPRNADVWPEIPARPVKAKGTSVVTTVAAAAVPSRRATTPVPPLSKMPKRADVAKEAF